MGDPSAADDTRCKGAADLERASRHLDETEKQIMARQAADKSALQNSTRDAERAERELNADVNDAIARTDGEVFTDAMGDEPLGEDDDTSLEDMGEGLEGDQLDEDEEAQEGDAQDDDDQGDDTGDEAEGASDEDEPEAIAARETDQ